MNKLIELVSERAELSFNEEKGFRFCIDTDSFNEKEALEELGLNKKELKK